MPPEDQRLTGPFAEADARLAGEPGTAAAFVRCLLGPAQVAAASPIALESIPQLPLPGIAIEALSKLSPSPDQGRLLLALLGEIKRRTKRLDATDEQDLRSFLRFYMELPDIVPPIGVSQIFSSIMGKIFEELSVAAVIATGTGQGN
jgi:hypothetical protein